MLIDANELSDQSEIACDVCIAGAGPAGIVVANALADAQLKVCLIERGDLTRRGVAGPPDVVEQRGTPVDLLKFERHSFGGASNQWAGAIGQWFRLKPMDPIDFEPRPWLPESGWPFSYHDLAPYLERATGLFDLIRYDDFDPHVRPDLLADPFSDDHLSTTIYQLTKPLRFGERYRSAYRDAQDADVYYHARVVEIVEDPDAPVVRAFRIATADNRSHLVRARHFVLACAGLEIPRLLLASRGKSDTGIGNAHDLVGRYYMQHPKGIHGIALIRRNAQRTSLYTHGHRINGVKVVATVTLSDRVQREEHLLNHSIMLQPIFSLSESHAAQVYRAVRRIGSGRGAVLDEGGKVLEIARSEISLLRHALGNLGRYRAYRVANHMEQAPKPESRVGLAATTDAFGVPQLWTDWRIDAYEKRTLRRLHEILRQRLEQSGAGRLISHLDPEAPDWPVAQDSAHHLGTTRMHADPKHGVVDANGRVHGVQNLFVSGGSVFPTSGNANPTLTLLALALRLGDHIRQLCEPPAVDVKRPAAQPERVSAAR